jgi:hypothetical protein
MHSTWTLKTIEDGETGRVETGLSQEQAVKAIERAMRGQDPLTDTATHRTVRLRSRGEHGRERSRAIAA